MGKRIITAALAALLCFVAGAQEIRDIETEVHLFKTGNAVVVQKWDLTATEGTEWYIPIDNPGKSRIRDFQVFEHGEEFANEGDEWSSKRSMAEKAQRCGIVRKKGNDIELCWGLGSYGDHVFTIMYVIENLVQSYEDGDGFHWHFLNDDWYVNPRHASITIINETDTDPWYWNSEEDYNVRFWGFGMVGDSGIEDGVIRFESTESFRHNSFFSAVVQFNKGLFAPAIAGDGTMEELKETAFVGSDYGKSDDEEETWLEKVISWILLLVAIVVLIILPVAFVFYLIYRLVRRLYWRFTGNRYKKEIFGTKKIDFWWRDIPLGGNPTALYSLIQKGDNLSPKRNKVFSNLVSAYFLKWIQEGIITVEKDVNHPERVNLRFVKGEDAGPFADKMEDEVYHAALEAAGENKLLEENEFKRWSYRHDSKVVGWPAEAEYSGKPIWEAFSPRERCQAIAFKKYLENFTLMDEREAPEVGLWKQYMIMAASLGVADKVAKNFEKLYPKLMEEYARSTNMMDTATTYTILRNLNTSSNAMMSSAISHDADRKAAAAAASRRSSGGGGSISFGGGGGGFGGGHGGGAR